MTIKTIFKKLTSRKFLTCAAGIITGIAMIYGADASDITTVAGAITALGSIITYTIMEGKVDAAAVKKAVDEVDKITTTVTKTK